MGVKKVSKKKAVKKEPKFYMKTAVGTNIDSHEIYEGNVLCPYCDTINAIEQEYEPPDKATCYECEKDFKVKWE